tara:strand:+ start:54 stop:650 length:597 start_codon:yes stop_codon:yes gene_type:complete
VHHKDPTASPQAFYVKLIIMQHKGAVMPENKTTTPKTKDPTDGRSGNARRKSFRLDEDTVIGVWAEHNREYEQYAHTHDEEAKYQAYVEFCYKVFCALTDSKIAKKYPNGQAPNRILDFPERLNGVLDKDKTEDEIIGIVYHFMNERLCRKCDDLLPELKRYDANINLPYGQEWANWMYSEERKWQNRASLFHTVTGE